MKLLDRFEEFLFSRRRLVLGIFAVLTLFFGFQSSRLFIDAGFEKLLPLRHPFMQTFVQYRDEFGGANKLLIAVRAREGDIFTAGFFETLKSATDEVFFLPGVNRGTVTSIYTPNVRFIEIVEGGFTGGNVIPAEFQPTPEMLATVRENVLKSGQIGRLVANDLSAAMITAELLETDPATGEKLNYLEVAKLLESKIRDPHTNEHAEIHIIGFAKALGDIAEGAMGMAMFFLIAIGVTFVLVYVLSRSFRMTFLPILCSIIAVVWTLGILTSLNFGLDPMSLLVPFLIFAIGVSHGVQMINAVSSEIATGADSLQAARSAFTRLKVPGIVALLSDSVGFLTLLLIDIGMIRELAIASTCGVLVVIFTNLILLPLLLSHITVTEGYRRRLQSKSVIREHLWKMFVAFGRRKVAVSAILVALTLGTLAFLKSDDLRIGDFHEGVPELRSDARYNRDATTIAENFTIGVDILTVIVETTPDGCIEHDVMSRIDDFQWRIANVPGVQSAISLPHMARIINAGWNEGHLKWRVIPRDPTVIAQAISPVETSTGLLNSDCSAMPVYIFTEDHKAETIDRVVAAVEAYAAEHDSDRHRFRLATGNVGVMAASNEVVRRAQFPMLLYIYAAVTLLCLIAFRSFLATLCIIIPLALVSVMTYALMAILEIGLKVPTLPVTALGVGIGVDYGIYIFSRLREYMPRARGLKEAFEEVAEVTEGKSRVLFLTELQEADAVLVTGLTLAVGTSTWIFSALKFQADMGVLLTFMFFGNMLGALTLLPALASLLVLRNVLWGQRPPEEA